MPINTAETINRTTLADRYKVIFAGIAAVILSVGIARFSYTPLLPVMFNEAGLSHFAGGLLATLNYVGYLIGTLLVSRIKDVDQKYLLYRLCLIVAVISTAAMAWTQNLYLWGALRVLSGFSSVGGILLAAGFVFDWLGRRGFKAELGLHFAGLGLGIVLSGVAAIAMQDSLRWDSQWEALGLLGIVFFIPAWIWMPKATRAMSTSADSAPAPTRSWMTNVTLAYFCAGFGYVISATFIVAILEAIPTFSGKGAWVWILIGLTAVPSSFVWDRIAKAIGDIKALLLSFGLQVISIVIPATTDAAIPNLLAAILFGITVTGIVSLMLALVGRKFPANSSAAMARLTVSYGVSQIVAPAVAGVMASAFGTYRGSLWLAGIMMLAGMVALWRLNDE